MHSLPFYTCINCMQILLLVKASIILLSFRSFTIAHGTGTTYIKFSASLNVTHPHNSCIYTCLQWCAHWDSYRLHLSTCLFLVSNVSSIYEGWSSAAQTLHLKATDADNGLNGLLAPPSETPQLGRWRWHQPHGQPFSSPPPPAGRDLEWWKLQAGFAAAWQIWRLHPGLQADPSSRLEGRRLLGGCWKSGSI